MKALAEYLHGKGLKLGIYSSPGPKTCGGFEGSFGHEQQDADTYAKWGIDFLKYDWCSYGDVAKDASRAEFQKPYRVMRAALDRCDRDIVYSLCQYGMDNVWEWGAEVGANLWRTAGDIWYRWGAMSSIGFRQARYATYAGPGHWNDPDMLMVGRLGWGPSPAPTELTPNEQITQFTVWSLAAAPLLLSCDLSQLDRFTLDLVTNDEVIEVDQDPLGRPAGVRAKEGMHEVWARPLWDGTTAVGLFNRGSLRAKVTAKWTHLGLHGRLPVRDLWRQKDLGSFQDSFTASVPAHGAVLVKIGRPANINGDEPARGTGEDRPGVVRGVLSSSGVVK
jgi:alpha-galactosidase